MCAGQLERGAATMGVRLGMTSSTQLRLRGIRRLAAGLLVAMTAVGCGGGKGASPGKDAAPGTDAVGTDTGPPATDQPIIGVDQGPPVAMDFIQPPPQTDQILSHDVA